MFADSFKKWQLKSIGASRIESLVKSQVTFIKGASHIKQFVRNIGCHDVTKAALAIRYKIKLYII